MTEPAERVLDDARTLPEAVFQALGAASTAWEDPGGAGVFDSTRAKAIGDELLAGIRAGRWPDEKTEAGLDERLAGEVRAGEELAEAVAAVNGDMAAAQRLMVEDLGAILRELDLGDHARPTSPHAVVVEEVLPALAERRKRLAEAEECMKAQAAAHDAERARRDPEAVAFERCTQALRELLNVNPSRGLSAEDGFAMGPGYRPTPGPVERVLGYLAARFGVDRDADVEVTHLTRRLQAAEAERDRLRAQLANVSQVAAGDVGGSAWLQ